MIEIEIYKQCSFFSCHYGLKKVPETFRPIIENFLKEHVGHWESYESHPERGVSVYYHYIVTPPKAIPWEELEKKEGIKVKIMYAHSFLIFEDGCDSEVTDDPDVWFS